MTGMTKHERIQAALRGDPVDRMPVAFWKHWPVDDQDAESMAERALEYQRHFDFDFIKIPRPTPTASPTMGARVSIAVERLVIAPAWILWCSR